MNAWRSHHFSFWPLLTHGCARAGACLGRRGSSAAEIRGAGEGRGRAPAGRTAGPQTARRPGSQGQGRWARGDAGKGGQGLVAVEESKSKGILASDSERGQ
jgi:hypothetical protein